MHGQTEMKEQEFRFNSRKEYEKALADLVPSKKKKLKEDERANLDWEYEKLIEEYLKFCETETDGE